MTLNEHFELCKEQLYDGELIINYFDREKEYELTYDEPFFSLVIKNATRADKSQNYTWFNPIEKTFKIIPVLTIDDILKKNNNQEKYTEDKEEVKFGSIEDFWIFFKREKKWYSSYLPKLPRFGQWEQDKLLAKYIIEEVNSVREIEELKKDEHRGLLHWEIFIRSPKIDRNEFKFFCPNCKKSIVQYMTAYPEPLCFECCKLVTDEYGEKVTFGHGNGQAIAGWYPNKKSSYDKRICYINSKEFSVGQDRWDNPIIYYKFFIP